MAAATWVVLVLTGLGALLGVVWQVVTPGAEIVMTRDGPVHADVSSENYFSDDAWFALIGAVSGVLSAIGSWFLVRRCRGPLLLVGTVVGSLLAALVAWQVGRHIGLSGFEQLLDHAKPGERFRRPARLSAMGVLGLQGFFAAFTYTLLAGWSRWPMLRRPTPEEWRRYAHTMRPPAGQPPPVGTPFPGPQPSAGMPPTGPQPPANPQHPGPHLSAGPPPQTATGPVPAPQHGTAPTWQVPAQPAYPGQVPPPTGPTESLRSDPTRQSDDSVGETEPPTKS